VVGDDHLAEDVSQDAWVRAFEKLHLFRGDAAFGTWMHRLAVNAAVNQIRSLGRRSKLETSPDLKLPVQQPDESGLNQRILSKAMDMLPEGYRTVLHCWIRSRDRMKQGIMGNHLTREQIAALLDEPGAVAGGLAHLDGCEDCAREFEGMSRMRMALSGLPELSPPAGEWAAIRARLPKQISGAWFGSFWTTPMAAAAIILLFLGGLGIGRMIAPTGPNGSDSSTNLASATIDPGANAADGSEPSEFGDYLQQVGRLRELRDAGPVGPAVADDSTIFCLM